MKQELKFYEKKIINDAEFPINLHMNRVSRECCYFPLHWHEHIELHYVVTGKTKITLEQKDIIAEEGSLVIANSNVLHAGYCDGTSMVTLVVIFEMEAFSKELAEKNIIFQPLIEGDNEISRIMSSIRQENESQEIGYRLACKGGLLQLITYLSRHYVLEMLSDSDSMKRMKNLERLNTVNQYIEEHYTEAVTNKELADIIHLSEDRFNHLFKESMGMPPLQYMNEIRLRKAKNLLQKGEYSSAEVAAAVGFTDYNHFGRMFRRYFGCTPMDMRKARYL